MFSYKIFRVPNEVMVSVCDEDILGKELGDSGFKVSEDFYGGDICGEEELREILKEATIINAVGNKIVSFLVGEKIIDKRNVIKIGGVSHAQVVTL